MSQANKTKVYHKRATGGATAPTGFTAGTATQVLRSGGRGTSQDEEEVSDVVRGDGQTHDAQIIGRSSDYSVEAPLVAGANHTEIEAVLRRAFDAAVTVTGSDIDFVAASNKITSLTADKFADLASAAGLFLVISGSGDAANNSSRALITSVTTGGGTEEIQIDADWLTLADDTGATVTLKLGAVNHNGSSQFWENYLEQVDDGTGAGTYTYVGYVGQVGNQWQHNIGGKGAVRETFNFMGADYLDPSADITEVVYGGNGAAAGLTLTDNAALSNEFVQGGRHLEWFAVDTRVDDAASGQVLDLSGKTLLTFSHDLNGNVAKRPVPGIESVPRIDRNDFSLAVNLSIYHEHAPVEEMILKQRRNKKVRIAHSLTTPEGGRYIFAYHRVQLRGGTPQIGGKNATNDGQHQGTAVASKNGQQVMLTVQYFAP